MRDTARTFVVEPVAARREAATAWASPTCSSRVRRSPMPYAQPRTAGVPTCCSNARARRSSFSRRRARPPCGMLSLVGYTAELSSVSYGDWVTRELRLVASLAYTHEDFLAAMATLASGAVEVGPVITGTVGLLELAAPTFRQPTCRSRLRRKVHRGQR